MKFTAERKALLSVLQTLIGVVSHNHTIVALRNLHISASPTAGLSIIATDLDVELLGRADAKVDVAGEVTIPAKKLRDILKSLPDGTVTFSIDEQKAIIRSGKSRFTLTTLPAADFPRMTEIRAEHTVTIDQADLQRLIEKTHFAMANNDVRYYLNGMLLELSAQALRAVATDGHRLAFCELEIPDSAVEKVQQVILPRKGVLELQRLLSDAGTADVTIGSSQLGVKVGDTCFTAKLVEGRFPEYPRVIPVSPPLQLSASRSSLSSALQRAAILSNEKYRGVRLSVKKAGIVVQAHNPENEEAEEEIEVSYTGADVEIAFNVSYMLDALAAIDGDEVSIAMTDGNSGMLITSPVNATTKYVVMPMRL